MTISINTFIRCIVTVADRLRINMKRLFEVAFVVGLALSPFAQAASRVGPVLVYQNFTRTTPEIARVERWGAGLGTSIDIVPVWLAFELTGLYISEETEFSTRNTFNEKVYRGRTGMLFRFLNVGPIHLGARGGAQFDYIMNTYTRRATNNKIDSTVREFTPYWGGQLELVPLSGFGLQAGVSFFRDKTLNKTVSEYFLGISIR